MAGHMQCHPGDVRGFSGRIAGKAKCCRVESEGSDAICVQNCVQNQDDDCRRRRDACAGGRLREQQRIDREQHLDDVDHDVDATLQQYSRYRASLNLGVLNSRPLNPNFSERKGVIVEGEADKRGPEYVAAMVIHGLPHYLSSWLSTFDEKTSWSYKGRDLVHDHHWKDKIGLVIAAGTSDPAKRFGVGLSFELFNGVSLLGVREFAKSQVLDGVNLGDAIASGSTVPTKTEWRRSWSFGLAFDLSYVSKVFALKF